MRRLNLGGRTGNIESLTLIDTTTPDAATWLLDDGTQESIPDPGPRFGIAYRVVFAVPTSSPGSVELTTVPGVGSMSVDPGEQVTWFQPAATLVIVTTTLANRKYRWQIDQVPSFAGESQ